MAIVRIGKYLLIKIHFTIKITFYDTIKFEATFREN